MSKHTPGPWKLRGPARLYSDEQAWCWQDGRGSSSASEREANARLIAKAPEMYEPLEFAVHQWAS